MHRLVKNRSTIFEGKWDLSDCMDGTDDYYVYLDTKNLIYNYVRNADEVKSTLGEKFQLVENPLLQSDAIKYLIPINSQFFHLIVDLVSTILKIHRDDPSAIFLLYSLDSHYGYGIGSKSERLASEYLQSLLTALRVRHLIISEIDSEDPAPASLSKTIKIKNYCDFMSYSRKNNLEITFYDIAHASRLMRDHAGDPAPATEHRKVYLTRSHLKDSRTPVSAQADFRGYSDDNRIDNARILEDFFAELGYEIIVPEEKFKSYKEQIQYMKSVKVLASISGSGLTNMLFMDDNQTVVEVVAEILYHLGPGIYGQSVVSEVSSNSFAKRHTHVLIQSHRDSSEVVASLNRIKGVL